MENNKHEQLWTDAIAVVKTMEFVKKRPNDQKTPAVLRNWIHTLEGFRLLNDYLRSIKFLTFTTRAFNQDPLENFFGQVPQYGVRNINPNCNNLL